MLRYWMFRIAAAVVPMIPMGIARPVAVALGTLLWALAGAQRQRVTANLRHVPSLAGDERRLRGAVRSVFQHLALNYLDFFRGAHLSEAEVLSGWTVENQDVLEAMVAKGRGVILLGGHFGNFEQALSRLGALTYTTVTPVERMKPEAVFELFCRLREHHGMHLVPADSRDSVREMIDTLKRGELVAFLADRYVLGSSADVPFFGEPARLPTGPFTLAQRTGAPVVCAFSWREGPGRAHGIFLPVTVDDDEARRAATSTPERSRAERAEREAGVARLQRAYVAQLERIIAAHPEQWVATLYPIWETQQKEEVRAEAEEVSA
ncbi:MAG: lysophospholipid acyltransferase family protein [Ktedonobacterales bacterium]